jgi:hypothetical protein
MSDVPSSASTADKQASPPAPSAEPVYPGTPRWVKVGAIVALVVVLLVVFAMALAGGQHGPMRHLPTGSAPIHHQSQLAVSLWLA